MVSCTLYLQVGDKYFPDEGWIDFASELLPPWSDGIASILEHGHGSTKCLFMEGPFSFVAAVHNANELEITLIEELRKGLETSAHIILAGDIVHELLSAAELLSRTIEDQKWTTLKRDELRRAIERLRSLKRFPTLQ